ncbi:MAG TPA: hypothetical protein VFO16_11180 [Pseudonocardiaceae bacterium]|nr:hypothetical protein [Pseudonocardiaceae bacterium]
MSDCFSPTVTTTISEIRAAYEALGERFRDDLYVAHAARPLLRPAGKT